MADPDQRVYSVRRDILRYLINDRRVMLRRFSAASAASATPTTDSLTTELAGRYAKLAALLDAADDTGLATIAAEVRQLQLIGASLTTSCDWQSPPFAASGTLDAGVQTGSIKATISDYKRDRHYDEEPFEEGFLDEFLGGQAPFAACHVTSSGMAAATVALTYLAEKLARDDRPVALGKRSYFELKELAAGILGPRVFEYDERDPEGSRAVFDERNPAGIIIDTYTNTADAVMPDISRFISWFNSPSRKRTYAVVDNSCLSIGCAVKDTVHIRMPGLTLIGIESLNKFYQYGMDRVTGGIVYGWGSDIGRLFTIRDHTGTNIPDSAVHALPHPSRAMLSARLRILGDNAAWLASELARYVTSGHKAVTGVSYPGLPSSPDYTVARKRPFAGAFFTLAFRDGRDTVSVYRRFVDRCIAEAAARHVDIVGGTSFGFDTTRIYLTAMNAKTTTPFVRISPGTEPPTRREAIRDAVIAAIDAM